MEVRPRVVDLGGCLAKNESILEGLFFWGGGGGRVSKPWRFGRLCCDSSGHRPAREQ